LIECHLGPVNTMRMPIDGDHFFSRQGALSVMYLMYLSEGQRRPEKKWPRPEGLLLRCSHTALRIAHLENQTALCAPCLAASEEQRWVSAWC
jgi:hypothetical protein